MTFEYLGLTFDGTYPYAENLQPLGGVYVIWDRKSDNDWSVLDIGKAIDVRARTMNHDRERQWANCAQGDIRFSAAYINDEDSRCSVESRLRSIVNPPCGDR